MLDGFCFKVLSCLLYSLHTCISVHCKYVYCGLNVSISDFHFQLEAISEMNPVDLRKQMRVEFKGEEGLDEGGLQKELFQLLIEKLLDPMYGE